MWFDHDIFCINVSAALYTKWIKGLLGVESTGTELKRELALGFYRLKF